MAAVCQPLPGTPVCAPPPTTIWVKRWELSWQQTAAPCPGAPCSYQQVATCTFLPGQISVPALEDWPRWKPNPEGLPLDEYYKLSYVPQYVCPDPCAPVNCLNYCGLQPQYLPVWTRIETPRAWRWIPGPCPPGPCPPGPCPPGPCGCTSDSGCTCATPCQ